MKPTTSLKLLRVEKRHPVLGDISPDSMLGQFLLAEFKRLQDLAEGLQKQLFLDTAEADALDIAAGLIKPEEVRVVHKRMAGYVYVRTPGSISYSDGI